MARAKTVRQPSFGGIEVRHFKTVTTYRAKWRADGKQQGHTLDTWDEACDFLDAIGIEMRAGGAPLNLSKMHTPFRVVAEAWYAGRRQSPETQGSRKKERSHLDAHLLPAFGDRPIGSITRQEVQAWVNLLDAEERSAWSINGYYTVLNAILREAALDGYFMHGAPTGKGLIKLPSPQRRMMFLSEEQVQMLLDLAGTDFPTQAALVHLAAHTGMRLGELLALLRGNVHGDWLLVAKAVKVGGHIGNTKTGQKRRIELFPCCVEVMKQHLAGHEHELVFPAPEGGVEDPNNWRKRHWYPLRKAAGFEDSGMHFHDLRHTHCSLLLASDWDVISVAERLGHSSPKMTLEVYGHAIRGRQRELADKYAHRQ